MARYKTVRHTLDCSTGKRRFEDERDAEKALGRAQAKHRGQRGGHVEQRYYYCGDCDGYHLTHMSRRQHAALVGVA